MDGLAQKYGWTVDYIMWGVSFANIKMMMADSVSVHFDHNDDNGRGNTESTSIGEKMNFSEFMKTMHGFKRTKDE
ncbi:MAG: hypothetical protein E7108_01925 [Bacteroidales bacterium]|nr:hypothetical protein [Bacteroidales bacterium]